MSGGISCPGCACSDFSGGTRSQRISPPAARPQTIPKPPPEPATPTTSTSRVHLPAHLSQSSLQSPPKSRWHLDHPLVAIQPDHIPRPLQHRRAALACAEMLVHRRAQRGVDFALEIIRNLVPHPFAVHGSFLYHGLLPFSNGNRLNQPCSHPAASRSRNINRARSSRVFTDATEIPSASAVS